MSGSLNAIYSHGLNNPHTSLISRWIVEVSARPITCCDITLSESVAKLWITLSYRVTRENIKISNIICSPKKKTHGSYVHHTRNFPLSNKLYFQRESFSDGSSGGLPLVVYTIKLTLHLDWSLGVSYNSYMHIQTSPSFHLPARSDTSASPLRSSRHKNNQLPPP